jgi:CP family cyanate transporter-like MFS transporter
VLGGTLGAVAVVPLAGDGGDWRLALGVVTVAGLVSLAIWLGLAPPDEIRDETLAAPRVPWRNSVAWLLGTLFGLQSLLYYGVITWLAAIYVDRGWSEPAAASLVALFGAVTLVATTVMPLGADRIGSRRSQLVASALAIVIGLVGVAIVPDPAVVWAIILGAGMGAIFPIVLTLPVDVGGRPADVAATAAMMLLVGYVLSAVGPLAFGITRDVTGGFALGLAMLIGLGVVLVVLCAVLTPARLHRTRAARVG